MERRSLFKSVVAGGLTGSLASGTLTRGAARASRRSASAARSSPSRPSTRRSRSGRLPQARVPDDQGRRAHQAVGAAAAGDVAGAAADRPHRPVAVPRGAALRRPGPHLRARRRDRDRDRSQAGRQDPPHRPHRPQGPGDPPVHAAGRRQARLPVRRGADAEQRDGRALSQFRARGDAGGAAARPRRADDEVLKRRRCYPQEQDGDADRVPALRAQPADRDRDHRAGQPPCDRSGAGGDAQLPPDGRSAGRGDPGQDRGCGAGWRVRAVQDLGAFRRDRPQRRLAGRGRSPRAAAGAEERRTTRPG